MYGNRDFGNVIPFESGDNVFSTNGDRTYSNDELDDDLDPLIEDGTKHTAETLAALLASLDPELVEQALEIAGLMDFMHG